MPGNTAVGAIFTVRFAEESSKSDLVGVLEERVGAGPVRGGLDVPSIGVLSATHTRLATEPVTTRSMVLYEGFEVLLTML